MGTDNRYAISVVYSVYIVYIIQYMVIELKKTERMLRTFVVLFVSSNYFLFATNFIINQNSWVADADLKCSRQRHKVISVKISPDFVA